MECVHVLGHLWRVGSGGSWSKAVQASDCWSFVVGAAARASIFWKLSSSSATSGEGGVRVRGFCRREPQAIARTAIAKRLLFCVPSSFDGAPPSGGTAGPLRSSVLTFFWT